MIAYLLLFIAAGTSFCVALRRRAYRQIAALLLYGLASDIVRVALLAPNGPGPYEGLERVACHARQALFLGWYAILLAVALSVFLRLPRCPVWSLYLFAVAVLVLEYPELRGDSLAGFYAAVQFLVVLAISASAGAWWRSTRPMHIEHVAVLILWVCETASLLWGPWAKGAPWARWDLAVAAYGCAFIGLTILQGVEMWKRFRSYAE